MDGLSTWLMLITNLPSPVLQRGQARLLIHEPGDDLFQSGHVPCHQFRITLLDCLFEPGDELFPAMQ